MGMELLGFKLQDGILKILSESKEAQLIEDKIILRRLGILT